MESLSGVNEAGSFPVAFESAIANEEAGFFSSEKFQNVKSGVSKVATAAMERISLAWSNVSNVVRTLARHGAEKYQEMDNKLMGAGYATLAMVASLPFAAASSVMGLFGMDIKPYLEPK